MDIAVQKCSGEVKQRHNHRYSLLRYLKFNGLRQKSRNLKIADLSFIYSYISYQSAP